jgi:CDP-diglyceride synthetase
MHPFPKKLSRIISLMSAFMLGAYITQEYKFHQPVEAYRYILTFSFGLMFYLHSEQKD